MACVFKVPLFCVIFGLLSASCALVDNAARPTSEADKAIPTDFEGKLRYDTGRDATDYSHMDNWVCTPEGGSHCTVASATVTVTDGSSYQLTAATPISDLDCFYIYPTVDFDGKPGNHDDLEAVFLPLNTVTTQAAWFSRTCRLIAPLYRQATLGSYAAPPSDAVFFFKRAYQDIHAAFQYYLEHWWTGQRIVIMGHSQGGQMASYLLHRWFDGDRPTPVTGISTSDLRAKLVLAMPIGSNVFAPKGEREGGSLADIPPCLTAQQTGCTIHYRSFFENDSRFRGAAGSPIDDILADEGFLARPFDPDRDHLTCTNPAMGSLVGAATVVDADDNKVADADRLFAGSVRIGLLGGGDDADLYPGRYSATCRVDKTSGNRYLAIGYHEPVSDTDQRKDPLNLENINIGSFGLHLADFNLAKYDLELQIRRRAEP